MIEIISVSVQILYSLFLHSTHILSSSSMSFYRRKSKEENVFTTSTYNILTQLDSFRFIFRHELIKPHFFISLKPKNSFLILFWLLTPFFHSKSLPTSPVLSFTLFTRLFFCVMRVSMTFLISQLNSNSSFFSLFLSPQKSEKKTSHHTENLMKTPLKNVQCCWIAGEMWNVYIYILTSVKSQNFHFSFSLSFSFSIYSKIP